MDLANIADNALLSGARLDRLADLELSHAVWMLTRCNAEKGRSSWCVVCCCGREDRLQCKQVRRVELLRAGESAAADN